MAHSIPASIADPHDSTFSALDTQLSSYQDPSNHQNTLISPINHNQSLRFNDSVSVSGFMDSQSPSSARTHRLSFGSAGHYAQQLRPLSRGGSDPASPGSPSGHVRQDSNTVGSQDGADGRDKGDGSELTPAWAELKTKAGKERKRLPLACIACRRKKIRCSGEKPACKHCLRSRIPCVYKVTTRKAAPRTDYMAMLDKRLKRMEDRVIKIMPRDEQRNLDVIGRAVVKPAVLGLPAKSAANKKRGADEAFKDELGEWSKTKSGDPKQSGDRDNARDSLLVEGAEHLPSQELQLHLAEVFFDYVYGQSYHLLHKPSYMRKLENGTLPPVLVLAVCAISARFSSHPEMRSEPAFLRGEQWAKPAREITLKRYDTPNITILIAYLILGLHEFGTCHGGRSWMLGGMAQRMAYALQLQKDLNHEPTGKAQGEHEELTFTDREIRRRTMWACFMMDRFNSSGTDRPLFVAESNIQAQLPIKESYFQMEITGPTEDLDGSGRSVVASESGSGQLTDPVVNMGVAAFTIRLVSIWGRIVRYMNLGGRETEEGPMWSEGSTFRELKDAVEKWKTTLPETLRWSPENLDNHVSDKIANQFIFMHIIYHQTVLFMNRFALPIPGSHPQLTKDMPHDFRSACGRAALEGANQISILVKEAMDHRVVAPFAGYSAFFSSTVHVHGLSSKNPALEASSKQFLAWNVKYLSKMKKHWGMFHFVTEHLKELYRRHTDAGARNAQVSGGAADSQSSQQEPIFQYGDWFDRYPHGVSGTDYEEPVADIKKEPGSDAVLGQKSDLQSVEEFFAKMSPPSRTAHAKKVARKKRTKSVTQGQTSTNTAGGNNQTPQLAQGPMPQHPQVQIPRLEPALMQQDYSNQLPYDTSPNSAFPNDLSNDMALLQAQQQQQQRNQQQQQYAREQPAIMSHLDRQMVLSSYAGTDPSIAQSHFSDLSAQLNAYTDMDMSGYGFADPASGPPDAAMGMSATAGGGGGGPWDQTSAWFMPFNLDPPNMGDESGLFGGSTGLYDFGMGMHGFPDLDTTSNMDMTSGAGGIMMPDGERSGQQ